jgi:putative DNA primase/helicase
VRTTFNVTHLHQEPDILYNKNGTLTLTLANLATVLMRDSEWLYLAKGATEKTHLLAKNLLTGSVVKLAVPPWPLELRGALTPHTEGWTDVDTLLLRAWFDRAHNAQVSTKLCDEIVELVSNKNAFDPLLMYLTGLEWDGTPRLDAWLIKYMGAADNLYTRAVGRKWMLSAVARAITPGCQADSALIFEGPQNAGKSSAFRVLGGAWFTDQVSDFESKDASADLVGVWIVELGELAQLNKSKVEVVKLFITRRVDRFRAAYARRWQEYPRRCIFAGTSNPKEYLQDPTGARRFWPVTVGVIDLPALKSDRDQLWAEAVALFTEGARHELTREEAQLAGEETEARLVPDAWEDEIADWLDLQKVTQIKIKEILRGALKLEESRWDQNTQNRVARALIRLGWTKEREKRPGKNGRRQNYYFAPVQEPAQREPGCNDD